jgi:hypothetical protein
MRQCIWHGRSRHDIKSMPSQDFWQGFPNSSFIINKLTDLNVPHPRKNALK